MYQISGYKLTFDVRSEALDDPFSPGFSDGFEDNYIIHDTYASGDDYLALDGAPLSTQDQSLINPTKAIRISALEICNSGGYGPRPENYIGLFAQVPEKGEDWSVRFSRPLCLLLNLTQGLGLLLVVFGTIKIATWDMLP